MHREIAAEVERVQMIVEHADRADVHPFGLKLDAAAQIRVGDAGRDDREGPVLDRHQTFRVGVGRRAGHIDSCLQRSVDIGQRRRKALHQADIDRTAVDMEVDAIFRSERSAVGGCATLSRAGLEQRQRKISFGREPRGRVLLEA